MRCNLCNSSGIRELFQTRDYSGNRDKNYTLVRCQKCGLVFIHPLPTLQESLKSYINDYRAHQKPKSKISQSKIKRLFRETNQQRKGKLLDIGCGAGSDLRAFNKIGWEAVGVEINQSACEHAWAAGLEVICGTIFDAGFPDNSFDIVRLRHVLEHLDNPRQVLTEVKRILKPGGQVIITTPHIHSFNFALFRKFWYHLDVPRHLYLFNCNNLKQLARVIGFKIRRITFDSGTKGLRESIQRWAEEQKNPLGIILARTGSRISLFKHLLAPFTLLIDALRWGDTISIVLIKPR